MECSLKKIFWRKKAIKGAFNCPVCGSKHIDMEPLSMHYLAKMQKYQCIHNIFLMETLNLKNYSCKSCGASDRDRLYALYFENYISDKEKTDLLDIAPSSSLSAYIKRFSNVNYRSTDLYMDNVDDKQSITDMNLYRDEQFDFLICSHVLEHIPDDIAAMTELYRVLKKGGQGIVMVPINLGLSETLEDATCEDISVRWKLYGQDDHIRAYAKTDFISRLQSVGFEIKLLDIDYFDKHMFEQMAIFPTSVLYVVVK